MGEEGTRLEAKHAETTALLSTKNAVDAVRDYWNAGFAALRKQGEMVQRLLEMTKSDNERTAMDAMRLLIPFTKDISERIIQMEMANSLENALGGVDPKTIVLLKELVEAVSKNQNMIDAVTAKDATNR